MTSSEPRAERDPLADPEYFSLVLGGPLFQIWCRVRLSDATLKLAGKRIVVITLFCWLPLLVISVLEGHFLPGSSVVPFLLDMETHVRFLIATPLLIGAELMVHERLFPVLRQFKKRELLPKDARDEFDAAVVSALRLRNSVPAELMLIAFVYLVGVLFIWRNFTALDASTWYATRSAAGSKRTFAGIWFVYVSLPLFQFLLCRWYFRLFIWGRLLLRVSRIKLTIIPAHPDRAGGLAFLAESIIAFAPIGIAHGSLLAGQIAERIFHLGAHVTDFKAEIGLLIVFLLCVVVVPLLAFTPQLARAKRAGQLEYGALAQRYVRTFDFKWLHGGAPAGEALVGSSDIQSLADLGNSLEVVRTMRFAPITKEAVIGFTVVTVLPILPLLLTMMPLDELLKKLLGILF